MILTLIDIVIGLFLAGFGLWTRARIPTTQNSRLAFLYCEGSALVSLGIGIAYATGMAGDGGAALIFARIAASATVGTFLVVALLAFSFPYQHKHVIFNFLAFTAWLVASYFIFFTDRYLVAMGAQNGVLVRSTGPYYTLVTGGGFALGLVSAAYLIVRRFFLHSKIFRLQTGILATGLVLGYFISYILAIVLPFFFGFDWAYPLMPFGALLLAVSIVYGLSLTRLFDVRAAVGVALSVLLFSAIIAAVSGGGVALLAVPLYESSRTSGFIATALIAGATFALGAFLRGRFVGLFRRRGAYSDKLDTALAELDYARGRDYVIERVLALFSEHLDCAAVSLAVSGTGGELAVVGSTIGGQDNMPNRGAAIDHLVNSNVTILFKTEIVTNYDYHEVKQELLDLFDRFEADALVLMREGRDIIGALLLGGRRTGADFTDYDYQVLNRIFGKLFVTAYYLRNIAQESLVLTVDRELEFSDQIIESIQQNIDRVEHPTVDISYMTKSTRKLGGDFIDFIRVSSDRYICILGDVSGKGLNASMSMVILKAVIRTFLRETKDFKKLVVKTNDFIKRNLPRGTFFAGMFALFDFAEKTLYFVNCGVPVMFLLSSLYNNPVEMQGEGRVLGFVKDIEPFLNVRKAAFKSGDILVVTTDGLTDAESIRGARFGKGRLQESIQENRALPAERMVRFLNESVLEFIGQELNDDITVLVVKIL